MVVSLERKADGSISLFIDGDLQFDSRDEHIYHEALVTPAVIVAAQKNNGRKLKALVIGGGDGMSARELLKFPEIGSIELVDYDPYILKLAATEFPHLNANSLSDPRVKVVCEDAWEYVQASARAGVEYDIVVSDLTVAQNSGEAKFHSTDWYAFLFEILSENGVIAANAVSSLFTPEAFWSIFNSMLYSGLKPYPFHVLLPSFQSQGYGRDWGFLLAAKKELSVDIFNSESGQSPVDWEQFKFLKSNEQLKQLFLFPEEFIAPRKYSLPFRAGSDILMHYFYNSLEISAVSTAGMNSLELRHADLFLADPDNSERILPPEIREQLAGPEYSLIDSNEYECEELFARVVSLVPSLRRHQTREMIQDFVRNPLRFLESIDLHEMVERLLKRAAELPSLVVAELRLLKDKLVDWAGDYRDLFKLGMRVMTVVTLVVIIGNLTHPDAAYGKGEHGGGGDHGGDHGGRGDGGRGDRGDHGDRGFGRHDGFNHGWGDHYSHFNHWSHFGAWGHNWGRYGWARPWHSWGWGGWGGWGGGWGWSLPVYAGGGGFLNVNLNSNNTNQAVDEEGNTYPARSYNQQGNYQNYSYGNSNYNNGPNGNYGSNNNLNNGPNGNYTGGPDGGGPDNGPDNGANGGDDQTANADDASSNPSTADYRLGPDTDILPNGQIAINLNDKAYLLVSQQGTLVMDQASGKPIMSMANDPALLMNLNRELKRQMQGLQSAGQSRQSTNNWSQNAGFQNQDDDQAETQNIQAAVDRLNKAMSMLPPAPDQAPAGGGAPVPGAMEVFASTWMSPDGRFVIIKREDGSLAYMNGRNWYSDMGVTPLRQPYPAQFKAVVQSYLQSLVADSSKEQDSLNQEQQQTGQRLQQLQADLAQYNADPNADPQQQVQFGATEIPRQAAVRRTRMMITRAQRRMDMLQKQMNALPQETAAATKVLETLQS